MGKFEKFIVLAVLFLVTLILVVSLNTNESAPLAHASLGGVEGVEDPGIVEPILGAVPLWKAEDIDQEEQEVFDPSSALLSGQVDEADLLLPEDLIDLPAGTILIEASGLDETPDPNFFSMNVAEGDSYESIALTYYGDVGLANMVRQANDDPLAEPTRKKVMLPAFDMRVPSKDRVGGQTYTVESGDTFTGIALKVYRDATLWKKIYDANIQTCPSQDGLRPEMVLVIP